jgi:hypothetical protein
MGTLMDIINKAKGAAQAPAAPAAPAPAPATPAPATPAKKSPLELAAERALADRQKADGAKGINPPPIQTAAPAPAPVEIPAEVVEAVKAEEVAPVAPAPALAPTPGDNTLVPPAWRTRLEKGHKPRTMEEQAWRSCQTQQIPSEPQATPEHKTEAAEDVMRSYSDGLFILFVDCYPAKGASKLFGMTTLPELIRPMKDAVQQMKEVPHWNMVKFREGEILLAACVEAQFRKERPLGIVLCDSFSGEWKACGDVLTELADAVVRGAK